MNLTVLMQEKRIQFGETSRIFELTFLIRTPSSWRSFRCHGDQVLDLGIRKGMISTSSWVLKFCFRWFRWYTSAGSPVVRVEETLLWNNIFYRSKLFTLLFHFHSFFLTIQSACYFLPYFQGDLLGKGMTFMSGIVFVHRKGMDFKVRHGLYIEKGHDLLVQA